MGRRIEITQTTGPCGEYEFVRLVIVVIEYRIRCNVYSLKIDLWVCESYMHTPLYIYICVDIGAIIYIYLYVQDIIYIYGYSLSLSIYILIVVKSTFGD